MILAALSINRHFESVVHQQSLLCLTIKAACLKFPQFCPTRISDCDLLAYLGNILKQKLQTSANDKTENEIYKHFNRIMFKDLFSTLNLRYCKRKRVGCLPIYQTLHLRQFGDGQTVTRSFCLRFDQNSGSMAFSNTNPSKSSKPPKVQTSFFF